ncbi:MAG: hypothetical protein ACPGVG_14215 [Mycobacterium sp.]
MHIANAADMAETAEPGIDALLRMAGQINIDLDDAKLNALGSRVARDAQEDDDSRSDWRSRYDASIELAAMTAEEKNSPFEGASNVVYPLLAEASLAFANRSLAAIFDDDTIARATVNGDDPQGEKQARADRVGEHLNYQMTSEMVEWEPDMRRLLHMLPSTGCVFRKIWWSAGESRPMSCLVRPEHFIVNNSVSSLKSAPRSTMVFTLWPHEVEEKIRAGMFHDQDYGIDKERDEEQEFYEQIRRIDLDDDGYPEPYVVIVHKASSKVARVKACYGTRVVASEGGRLTTYDGQSMAPTHAQPGDIILNGDRVQQIVPMQYFVKYGLIPDPQGGFYDWGFGQLIGDMNRSVTTLLRQMIDAGTLRNSGGGILSKAFKGRQEAIDIAVGEWRTVDVSSEDLARGILPNPNPDPSPMGLQLIEVLVNASRSMTTQSDVASGDVAAQMAPTTMMALADQAMTGFRGLFKGVWHSLSEEVRMFAHLNRLSLDGETYFRFQDAQKSVAQQDYGIEDMDITPTADPDGQSPMQKASRGQLLMSMAADPRLDALKLYEEAFRLMKFGDIEKFIAPPQQPDPQAQQAALLAATKLQADIALIMAKVENERTSSVLKQAQAVGEIAEAEAHESGRQMNEFMAELQRLQAYAKTIGEVANVTERVRGMEGGQQAGLPSAGTPPVALAGGPF